MKFIQNHQPIFEKVFTDDMSEDTDGSNSSDHSELEEMNPSDTIEVAEFSAEVENWTTWIQRSFFYVCKVPKLEQTYLLFEIDWDDNWGQWKRYSHGAVEGANSHDDAGVFLLRHFAEENIENAGDGEWKEFLEELRQ